VSRDGLGFALFIGFIKIGGCLNAIL